jgi:predicted nuclease with TOPRIM domain
MHKSGEEGKLQKRIGDLEQDKVRLQEKAKQITEELPAQEAKLPVLQKQFEKAE